MKAVITPESIPDSNRCLRASLRGEYLTPIHPSLRAEIKNERGGFEKALDFAGACISVVSSLFDFRAKTIYCMVEDALERGGYKTFRRGDTLSATHSQFPDFQVDIRVIGGVASTCIKGNLGTWSGEGPLLKPNAFPSLFGHSNAEVAAQIISSLDQGGIPVPLTVERTNDLNAMGLGSSWIVPPPLLRPAMVHESMLPEIMRVSGSADNKNAQFRTLKGPNWR